MMMLPAAAADDGREKISERVQNHPLDRAV